MCPSTLEDDVCEALAQHYPFDNEQIKHIHQWAKSWDLTIATLNGAVSGGYADPLLYARTRLMENFRKEQGE